MSIGKRLKEERERLGFNQTDFAEAGGVGRKSQFNYEEDERRADTAYLAAIAGIGADVRFIVTGERDGPKPLSLSPEEHVLLDGFRALDKKNRARMLAFVLGAEHIAGGKVIIHGKVGQQVETIEGAVNIDMRSKK